jgi:hypothetical protein
MARERLADGASSLEIVSDRREHVRELFIAHLGSEKAEDAERGDLRFEQCRYLARDDDDVFIGYPIEKRQVELDQRTLLRRLDSRDDEIALLQSGYRYLLRGSLDGAVALVPVLVNRVILEEHGDSVTHTSLYEDIEVLIFNRLYMRDIYNSCRPI